MSTAFTHADIEAFFLSHCHDGKEHVVSGIYRLVDLSEPVWMLYERVFGDILQKMLDVEHIIYVKDGKLAICYLARLPEK